jgi:hypothetical protein
MPAGSRRYEKEKATPAREHRFKRASPSIAAATS